GALAGIPAYGVAIMGNDLSWPLLVTLPLGVAIAGGLGAIFSWAAVRRQLGVIFIGIITLAFSLVFQNVLLGVRDYTGGETGVVLDAGTDTFLRDYTPAYYTFAILVVAFLVLYQFIDRSHMGWAFRAL